MKPAFNKLSRRQFLLGTGGLALPLPLLPSLFPGNAEAQVVQESSKRFFVQTTTYHAVFASQFFGPLLNVAPSERIANYAGFEIRKAALKSAAQGNGTFISPILQTKKAPMSAKVLGLMNVINGLDMITFQGHNFGGVAGGSGSDPSIDQVMAASKKLFPGTQGAPAIVRHKVSLSKVGNNSGTQATTNTALTNVKLFDLLFGTNVAANDQPLIVDAVRSHLAAVRSDSAISAECRNLMDAHVEMMFQAETNLRSQIGNASGLARPPATPAPSPGRPASSTTPRGRPMWSGSSTRSWRRHSPRASAASTCGARMTNTPSVPSPAAPSTRPSPTSWAAATPAPRAPSTMRRRCSSRSAWWTWPTGWTRSAPPTARPCSTRR
jgi:hypothetical protein